MSLRSLIGLKPKAVAAPSSSGESEIVVQARPPSQPAAPPTQEPSAPPVRVGPVSVRDLIPQQSLREIAPHKGRFGVKGTLRDILGFIGDTYDIQEGRGPRYTQLRNQERAADAMIGMTQGPSQYREAIERVAALGQPELARQLMEDYNQGLERTARIASYDDVARDRKMKQQTTGQKLFSNAARFATAENYGQVRPYLEALREQYGLDETTAPVPESFDPNQLGIAVKATVPVAQQERIEQGNSGLRLRSRSVQIQGERAKETARSNKARERTAALRAGRSGGGGRSAPNPTAASIAAPLIQKARRLGGFDKLPVEDQQALQSLNMWPTRIKKPALPVKASSVTANGTRRIVKGLIYEVRNGVPTLVQ